MEIIAKIESDKIEIDRLNEEIAECEQITFDKNARMGGELAVYVNDNLLKGQKSALEKRINKLLKAKSEVKTKILEYRDKIDSERKNRVIFDSVYRHLEEDLDRKKKDIKILIEDSQDTSYMGDEIDTGVSMLKSKAEKEKAEFEKEMREFADLIRLHAIKRNKMKSSEGTKKQTMLPDTHKVVPITLNTSENKLNKSSNNLTSLSETDSPKNNIWSYQKDPTQFVTSYEELLNSIYQQTESSTPENVINNFINIENQNFSIYNYINNAHGEIEKLENSIDTLKLEIKKDQGQELSADAIRKHHMKEIHMKVMQTDIKIQELEKAYQNSTKIIDSLKMGIENILNRVNMNNSNVSTSSSGRHHHHHHSSSIDTDIIMNSTRNGVNSRNIIQSLGLIEQRTNEVLYAYAMSQTQLGVTHTHTLKLPQLSIHTHKQIRTKGGGGGGIIPPRLSAYPEIHESTAAAATTTTGSRWDNDSNTTSRNQLNQQLMFDEDDEEGDRPYTRHELHYYVANTI